MPLPNRPLELPSGSTSSPEDSLILSGGEVSQFVDTCAQYLDGLVAGGHVPSAVEIQRATNRATWAWFYARKVAPEAEHERLLLVFLGTLERFHALLLSAQPIDLIERVVVEKPPRRSTKQAQSEARRKTVAELLGEAAG